MPELEAAFSVERVQALLRTAWLGRGFVYEPVVGSTMDLARRLASDGATRGTVIAADEQTAGRGRLGRRWLAPPGVNLAFSIVLYPSLAQLRRLATIAPLAVADGVRQACGLVCSIKWPNDVQIGGRKLAGVLLESELSGETPRFALIGIGLNVNFDVAAEPEIAGLATSLLCETGRKWEREAVLAACLNAFEQLHDGPAEAAFERWRGSLNTLGQRVRVSFQGRTEEGIAEDVDADGSLILRRADGTRLVLPAGEVSLRT
jgi:BirA family biotin operon repressor/biotin-[acetyl-CoA-carboxylase] ligase